MSMMRDSDTKLHLTSITIMMLIVIVAVIGGFTCFVLIPAMFMWCSSVYYSVKREKLYKESIEIIEKFEDGDFSMHLSKNQEGSYYSMLAHVDRLAMTLKSRNDSEINSRELINNRISDISHQLKTPLAALLMYNEIIEQEPDNIQVVKEFNDKSKNSLERMQQLIKTLLIMTRLDSGSILFEKGKYYTGELIREAVSDLVLRAKVENKIIEYEGNEEDMMVCDKKWTMEAISNIVKNALDHTDEAGLIHISWQGNRGVTRIIIKDNGTGIKNNEICHIFKRFYQSPENKNAGLGLGLPLAKSIVEEQGGTILLESRWGEGTTMTLSFLQDES